MDTLTQDTLATLPKKKMVEIIPNLVENITTAYFNLGAMVHRVRGEGLFVQWGEKDFHSFEDWCETVLKFGLRKAQYLATIYEGVTDLDPKPILRGRLLQLGWAKVGQILRVADSRKSLREWVEVAEAMTLRQLQDKIRWALKGGKEDEGVSDDIAAVETTITRKFTLTEGQNAVLDGALEIISKRFPNASVGEMISMLAVNYKTMNLKDDEGGIAAELKNMIEEMESVYGVKLRVEEVVSTSSKKKKAKIAG